ncbi:protein-L-isoaspartate(D-aspartate) O-methyltransferase [Nocardiopsis sp. CNT-189]|uniref:protein-L-isoaspartate(D-aspartate) O-methyltransferase n=1 Tax=Nocardiopsis oceanisediminis TaxID=2816862 RepID=UPI003B2B1AD7
MTSPASAVQERLAERVALQDGVPDAVAAAVRAVPRHLFVPDRIRVDGRWLERSADPQAWLEAAYADRPVITQLDDGRPGGTGYISSSISKPSLVAEMLARLQVGGGDRVLEIGTGSGWNAALLCELAGEDGTTTIEVDPDLHARARAALAGAGHAPEAVLGDGLKGHPPGAPYERIISTMAVRHIPWAWAEQLAGGGMLLTPWGTAYHNGVLVSLRPDPRGRSASGRFFGDAAFMWARAQRTPHGAVEDRVRPGHDYAETATELYPAEPLGEASFAIGLVLEGVKNTVVWEDDVPGSDRFTVYLMDPRTGSWSSWHADAAAGRYPVRQHGPRRLFDELEAAHAWWVRAGRPDHTRFGLTITPDGEQAVWLDGPEHPVPASPAH